MIRATAIALAALVPQGGPADAPRIPDPLRPMAGMHGISVTSEVRMLAAPEVPQELKVDLAFPDRARWSMTRMDDRNWRRVEFLFGEHAFALEPTARTSTVPTDDTAPFARRSALRRAAFLWPDGAEWSGEGRLRTAEVFSLASDADATEADAIGALVAELDAEGRAVAFECRDAAGRTEERLTVHAWQTIGERSAPRKLRLSLQGRTIWEETVTSVRTGVRHADRYFLPADRYALMRPLAAIERQRVATAIRFQAAVPAGATWDEAVALAREHAAARAREGAGPTTVRIVLGDRGRPQSIELHRPAGDGPGPEGWTRVPACDAMRLTLGGLDEPAERDRERLRESIPAGRTLARVSVEVLETEIRLLAELAP